ncbi:MAG: DUF1559 domain-containing protein [Planctomycetes bacterium]|nr:DUF1559 domain-containing protein [Planctomycetota bacterium]
MKKLAIVAVLMTLSQTALAGDADRSPITPFLDDATFAVVRVNLDKVDVDAIAARLADLGLPAEQITAAKTRASLVLKAITDAGGKEAYAIWSMADRLGEPFFVLPVKDQQAARELSAFIRQGKTLDSEPAQATVLAGSPKALQRLRGVKGKVRVDLEKALAGSRNVEIQAAFVPPAILRKSLREAFPELPRELGGGSTQELEQGFESAVARIRLTPKFSLGMLIKTKSPESARELKGLIERLLDLAGLQKEIMDAIPDFAKLQRLLTPQIKENSLVLAIDDDTFQRAVKPALAKMRAAAQRVQDMNNLKQMALALHNYHDAYRGFPARASFDAQGNPLLSWRVHILPFIEHAELYKQFKLDEPWDSEHNKKLIARMPDVYRSPGQKKDDKGQTGYLGVAGKGAIFDGVKGVKVVDIIDGTSNTIMIVEVNDKNAVPWTKPADFSIDTKDPLARLVRPGAKGFIAAFADGSVRQIAGTITARLLHALFTRNGSEVIGDVP